MRKKSSLLLVVALFLAQVPLSLFQAPPVAAQGGGYTTRAPVYIEGDDNFTSGNGVNGGGDGSAGNPYIIENWAINASSGHGIYIKNTTVYFVIRNVLVENGGGIYNGIYLENVINGKVENCKTKNNRYGIFLQDSDNNILSGDAMESDVIGLRYSDNNFLENNIASRISLYYSDNNILENNTVENYPFGYGILLEYSDNNTLKNNTVENNYGGISLYSSSNNTLQNNTMNNNERNFSVWGSSLLHYTHNIENSNLINGRPLLYLVEEKDIVINQENNAGYLGMVNCDNVRVENLVMENNEQGLLLAYTKNSWIENVACSKNYDGIHLYYSDNNTLKNNTVENNGTDYGIFLRCSDNNTLENNTVKNSYTGIHLWYSENNILSGNTVENNQSDGIVVSYSDNNVFSGNNVKNHPREGIHISSSSYNTFSCNIVENCGGGGIYISSSSRNTFSNNTVENCLYHGGIYLDASSYNTFSNNTAGNSYYGIYLNLGGHNTLENNTVENSNLYGVLMVSSSSNILDNNTLNHNTYNFGVEGVSLSDFVQDIDDTNLVNGKPIVYLVGENGIVINQDNDVGFLGIVNAENVRVKNLVLEGNYQGVLLAFVENIHMENVLCRSTYCGFHLYQSNSSAFSGNTAENNSACGIYLERSENNILSGNTVENNSFGILVVDSHNNILLGNTVENDQNHGIYLWESRNNILLGNTVENNRGEGILLYWYSSNNTLTSNIIKNSDNGIALRSYSDNNILLNNTIRNSLNYGIYLKSSKNNTLEANAYDNSYGIPWISNVTVSDVTQNSATITWTTAENSTSAVEYGTSTAYGYPATDGTATSHSVTLSGLSAGTTYHYRVRSTDSDNNTEIYFDRTFTTSPAGGGGGGGGGAIRIPTLLYAEPSSFEILSGGSITLTATLRDNSDNRPLAGRTISWSEQENRGTFSQASGSTDENGQVKVMYTAPVVTGPENVRITFRFAGDGSYLGATAIAVGGISPAPPATSRLTISPGTFTVTSGENVELTVRLTDESGLPLAGKTIALSASLGEVGPSTGVTDNSGQVRAIYLAPTVEAPTSVTITASFAGDNRWLASRSTCSGTILPPETKMKLENLVSALENRVVELAIPIAGENLRVLENSFVGGRLGACLSIGVVDGVPKHTVEFLHPELVEPQVRVEPGKKIEVVVESAAVMGRTILLNIESQALQVPAEKIEVLFDGKKIGLADDYADVLDPTNESVPEYLIVAGGRGMQILVSVPSFSKHTITIRGPAAAGTPWAPLLTAVAIVVIVLVLLFVFRRK